MIRVNLRFCWPLVVILVGNAYLGDVNSETNDLKEMTTMILSSTAFNHNGEIPSLYTCDGRDISPPLAWKGVPEAAKSLVLIVDDPDAPNPKAPKMTWVHWVLYNLPPM